MTRACSFELPTQRVGGFCQLVRAVSRPVTVLGLAITIRTALRSCNENVIGGSIEDDTTYILKFMRDYRAT